MSITSMIMAITEEFNYSGDVPVPEYGNDGEAWHQTFMLLTVVPLIAFIISFIILYKFTKNKTRSLIGTIVGSIAAFIIGIGIPLPIESKLPLVILLSSKIPESIFPFALLIYCVAIIVVIGLLITPSRYFRNGSKGQ
jgi:hypothetical protein